MNEVNSVSKSFSGCKKVSSSEVITARIRALMADDKRKSQVYVHVRPESRDFYFEILPDMDSISYNPVLDGIYFTSEKGNLISTISGDTAEIYYETDQYEDDETHEYYHIVYPSGIQISIEILTLPNN